MGLKQIKNKIVSTQKTSKVSKAMEAVSAVKMRKSQERALKSRSYAFAATRILEHLARNNDKSLKLYTEPKTDGKILLILITSDKGLAGSVNSAVLKQAEKYIAHKACDSICIGKKAVDFANRQLSGKILSQYVNVSDDITLTDVAEIGRTVLELYEAGEYKEIHINYQNFVSTFEQQPMSQQLLPLDPKAVHQIAAGIRPSHGKYAEIEGFTSSTADYTYEPNVEAVLKQLVPQLIGIIIFHALIESKASEHSARMVAMKNATDKAKEIIKSLTLEFNKERQAVITAEVSEITGGIEALKT